MLITSVDNKQIWACPIDNCPFTTAVEHGQEMSEDNERRQENTLIRAHKRSHEAHGKLFTQAIGGGQWRILPAAVQNNLIIRAVKTWNAILEKQN
jgi:hypothetical protein